MGEEIKWITPKGGEFIYSQIDGKFMPLKHPSTHWRRRSGDEDCNAIIIFMNVVGGESEKPNDLGHRNGGNI